MTTVAHEVIILPQECQDPLWLMFKLHGCMFLFQLTDAERKTLVESRGFVRHFLITDHACPIAFCYTYEKPG